jgi:SAC3 family protein LENG8/THP3
MHGPFAFTSRTQSTNRMEDEDKERKKRLRSERFQDHLSTNTSSLFETTNNASSLPSPKRLKGTSSKLERPYLRLTSAPKPSLVRPLHILKLALENVKQKYVENEDYSFACEQLKSIRQGILLSSFFSFLTRSLLCLLKDLTVQNIHNRFVAHVYETHGRIALESGDLEEYNQCQSRLQEMRRRGIQTSADEFNCYRLLHSMYRGNKLEVISALRDIARNDSIVC